MRISFDVDDTLIFYDKPKNGPTKLFNGEFLRQGTIELLKDLQKKHELWIYTASLRRPWLFKFSFFLKGVKIVRVINQDEHLKLQKELKLPSFPTKFPSKYGIDLHIDDSEGVAMEGEKYGFRVLRVDPEDQNWTATIKEEIEKL